MSTNRILRRPEVEDKTGLSKSTIRRRELTDPDFPKRVSLGPNAVGWRESEVQNWIDSRSRVAESAAA